jgi:hypothetical protein
LLDLTVPDDGDYYLLSKGMPPYGFKDRHVSIPFKTRPGNIMVEDTKTGNLALFPYPKNGQIILNNSDFDHIRRVNVHITWSGLPVRAALVSLVNGSYSEHVALTPEQNGVAMFENVPSGKAKLTIQYGDNLSDMKDLLLSTDHTPGALNIEAALSNKTATLTPAAPATAASPTSPSVKTPSGGAHASQVGNLVNLIAGVVILGIAFYLLYWWWKSGGMTAFLNKVRMEAGTQTVDSSPFPGAAAHPSPVDSSICPFCGQKKDSAGNCACTIAGGVSPVAPVSVSSDPRLIGTGGVYSGSIFTLTGGINIIGREPSNAICLNNDTTVSRRHASIARSGLDFVIKDEGSANGVYINGIKITGEQIWKSGDEIQIGNTRFRLEI